MPVLRRSNRAVSRLEALKRQAIAELNISKEAMAFIDGVEAHGRDHFPEVECPLEHKFTPGLYTRTIKMPANSLVVSKIHKTEHPFVILQGEVSVWTEGTGTVRYKAPYMGTTKPGTRRILFCHEETIWATFHPTNETNLDKIEKQIIYTHVNPLLRKEQKHVTG